MYAHSMQVSTSENLDYCKNLIKAQDYVRFLQCAFAPHAYSYYALMAELAHIHDHVSEEMIGHIRYAWWQESIVAIGEGKPRQHPVLLMLAESNIDNALLIQLVESYREAWPELPQNPPELAVDNPRWKEAARIIAAHGAKPKWWLLVKLMCV
jgi:phytoene/squalene synthetase